MFGCGKSLQVLTNLILILFVCFSLILGFRSSSSLVVAKSNNNSKANLITWKEFKKTLTMNNYPAPSREQYQTVMKLAPQFDISTKEELAMFLAQVYWESAGLQHTKEIACVASKCPTSYRTGREKAGNYYYGRGLIQSNVKL